MFIHSVIVLASASPRRADLLRQLGVSFSQLACPHEEATPTGMRPGAHATALARSKALGVRALLNDRDRSGDESVIIGADTLVCVEGEILGKPADGEDAARMLRSLSGKRHQVYSGVCVLAPNGMDMEDCSCTDVVFAPLSNEDIEWYVTSGEPMDKAGSYAIQGLGARFVERIEGCYYNVVGLPLSLVTGLLRSTGYDFNQPTADTL